MEKIGIDNLKKLVTFGAHLASVGDKIGHTAGIEKWMKITTLFPDFITLTSVDFKAVKAEIADLDASERLALEEAFKAEFDLVDDKLEISLEAVITLAEKQVEVIVGAIELAKSFKAQPAA